MKKAAFLSVFILSISLLSCGKKEDPFVREQKEMDERLASTELQAYKSFKVAIRGTAMTGKDPAFDEARMYILASVGYALAGAGDSLSTKSAMELINTAKATAGAISTLSKTDEDSLPTVLQNIEFVLTNPGTPNTNVLSSFLNESEEHLVLGGLWITTPGAPPDLSLYEVMRVQEDSIRSTDFRLLAKISKALMCLQQSWPYHSEKTADELIALTEKEKQYFLDNPWPLVVQDGKTASPEQAWHQLNSFGYLIRSVARQKMEDRGDDAVADLEVFVKEIEAGGIDNELSWSAGAYVALKKEDKETALKYLDKLSTSTVLGKEELKAVKETRGYVANKENGKAFESFTDKIAFLKIGGGYFMSIVNNSKPVKQIGQSQSGKKFMDITTLPFAGSLDIPKGGVDSLMNKTKNILKDVF